MPFEEMRLNLIAPVYNNSPFGNENRLVNWLNNTKEGRDFDIDLTITDLRFEQNNLSNLSGKYDATLVIKGEMLSPEQIKYCSSPKILYFPDDIIVYKGYRDYIKLVGSSYDWVYTFDKFAIPEFKKCGCKDVRWLPSWTGVDFFNRRFIERDFDICFIGSINEQRQEMLDKVTQVFFDKNLYFKKNVYGNDYVYLLNKSKIVLNLAQGKTGTSQRVFEAAACEAMVLTNWIDESEQLYEGDKEVVYWNDLDELIQKLELYLNSEDKRKSIANAGFIRTIKDHLAGNRFKVIFDDIKNFNNDLYKLLA